jgi:hypothetical protein
MHRIRTKLRRPSAAIVVALVAGAVIGAAARPFVHSPFAPAAQPTAIAPPPSAAPEVVEGTVGPIVTGAPVASGSPGPAADSVTFSRPEFQYVGSQPWQLHRLPFGRVRLEAYASRPSYLPGDTIEVAVSTTAATFNASVWRVSGTAPIAGPFDEMAVVDHVPGHVQPPPTIDPITKMVSAAWRDSFSLPIPSYWPSGIYLVRLDSAEGVQQYVPFIVRSTGRHDVLVVASVMNWEAYNDWGGSSVYMTRVGQPAPGVNRALAVSLDRPYANDGGAGQVFFLELPFDAWVLRQGLDVAFTTDYDLSQNPDAMPTPRVIVFNGHDEYWGPQLYLWLDRHVNQVGDLGLAILAADTGYWPVDLEGDQGGGPRVLVIPKTGPIPQGMGPPANTPELLATPSPEPSGSAGSGASADIEERTIGILAPDAIRSSGPLIGSYPDQPLYGVRYAGITSALGRYAVGTGTPSEYLGLTGLEPGDSLGLIAGGEVDGISTDPRLAAPNGGSDDHQFAEARDVPGHLVGTTWTAEAVWRDLPNGGRVFSAGTFYWGWALDPVWGASHEVPMGFGELTANILRWLAHA